ncbi:SCO2400 family protein, partial [Streptomyces lonarensis]|uniref:SCO2400 family protein n=1 Tax=Streptomyces lonarensis TaxID=700599 RepID=UPI003B97E54B
MDYCAACRRHLNGALACPGCGRPAVDAGPAPDGPGASRPAASVSGDPGLGHP